MMAGCGAEACTAAVLIGVMRLEVCRLTVEWVGLSKESEPTSDEETEIQDDDGKKSGRDIRARDIKLPHAVQHQLMQVIMTWKVWPIPHSLQHSRQIL